MDKIEKNASKYKTKPYNHQLECINKFGRDQAFMLGAEQGTGKTWIIINNVADLWGSNDCDALFVVAPNGVHVNWTRKEIPAHMPDWVRYRAAPWRAGGRKAEKQAIEHLFEDAGDGELRIFTMNWEALQSPTGVKAAERFCGCFRRLMIVLDESDAAKNPRTERWKAIKKIKNYSYWRRTMTGTMSDGSPFSLFTQYNFLDESILGTDSYYAFKAEYSEMLTENHGLIKHIVGKKIAITDADRSAINEAAQSLLAMLYRNGREELMIPGQGILEAVECNNFERAIEKCTELKDQFSPKASAGKTNALKLINKIEEISAKQLRKASQAFAPGRLPQVVAKDDEGKPKYRNLDKLRELIAPHTFRVLKKDCLDLPDKIYKSLYFQLTKQQREIYDRAKEELRLEYDGIVTPFNKLVIIAKLAQITSGYYIHPLSEEPVRIPGEQPRLDLLADRCNAIAEERNKSIVWARYRVEIADIAARLREEGHKVVEYHGGVKKDARLEAIDSFEHGDAGVIVINQQAGGTGLTLVSAAYSHYFSNDYSLRNRLQSEDRNHRIGQKNNVVYYDYIAENTVDEQIVSALTNKIEVAEFITDFPK